LVVVPGIVVPAVLLFGFAGCSFEHGKLSPTPLEPEAPIISFVIPKSTHILTVVWKGAQDATLIQFERTMKGQMTGVPFEVMPSQTTFDDPLNTNIPPLEANTRYEYKARAVDAAGDTSQYFGPVYGTTLAIDFDARGTGNTGSSPLGNNVSTTWSHSASGDSRAVLVGLRWTQNGGFGAEPTRAVTYGGIPMTSLGVKGLNNALTTAPGGTYVELFGLRNPPGGSQTVSVTVSRQFATGISLAGSSVSYVRVDDFVSVPGSAGTGAGTSLTQTVGSAEREMVVQMFITASGTITGYMPTLRYDGGANSYVMGDARGAASVPFSASRVAGVNYAGLAVRLTAVMPVN
jgi:hypothetical protein